MLSLKLDLLQTLSLGAVLFLLGVHLRKRIRWLDRLNIPAAVVGGLVFALLVLAGRDRFLSVQLDTVAQPVLSVAFFSTIGMGASLALLRAGGFQVVIFLVFATLFCFVQNFLGIAIARGFGQHPLLGVMAGSVTLVGGPATGLAFAPLLEKAGLVGAGTLALTSATFGIVCGGLTGTPAGTWLIRRFRLTPSAPPGADSGEVIVKPPPCWWSRIGRTDR
jgi:ESS family glutamate:Na+ symporter